MRGGNKFDINWKALLFQILIIRMIRRHNLAALSLEEARSVKIGEGLTSDVGSHNNVGFLLFHQRNRGCYEEVQGFLLHH